MTPTVMPPRLHRSRERARGRADITVALLLAVMVAVLYLATITGGPAQVNDTRAASVAAWSLGARGSAVLPDA